MTSTEFATEIGRSYNTVLGWLRKGLIPDAIPQALGNETRWFIPKERVADFAQWDPKARWGKRGPAKKNAAKKAARAKKRTAGAQASLFEPTSSAKPGRKARAKKAAKKKGGSAK